MTRVILHLLLAATVGATTTDAQSFLDPQNDLLPEADFYYTATADIDADGDVDLFLGQATGGWELLLNDGTGRFARASTMFSGARLEVGDFDGDGDLDFITSRPREPVLYRQQNGTFPTTLLPPFASPQYNRHYAVDLDGDLDLDLVVASSDTHSIGPCQIYRNQGNGTFVDDASALATMPIAPRLSAAVLDLQGDGRPDLVFDGNPAVVMLQNPNGSFTHAPNFFPFPFFVQRVETVDIDADGNEDLLATYPQGMIVLRNDGAGTFTRLLRPIGAIERWTTGDIDGDGDPDLLTLSATAGGARLWRVDPGLAFVNVTATNLPAAALARGFGATFLDSDGDGDQDLVLDGAPDLLHNDGSGRFRALGAAALPSELFGPAVADLDEDGLPDVVAYLQDSNTPNSANLFWWQNRGAAGFWRRPVLGSMFLCDDSFVRLVDLDGDRRPEIWALTCGLDRVWHNRGSGVFVEITSTVLPQDTRADRAVVTADFDGDGDLDAFVPRDFLFDSFYINQGNLTFTEEGRTRLTDNEVTRSATAIDFDGDGDLDLALINDTSPLRLFANDGRGQFQEVIGRVPTLPQPYDFVLSGDLDGDRAPDLLLATRSGQMTLLDNVSGNFVAGTPTRLPTPGQAVHWPQLVDFDRDGDLDLFTGEEWLRNDGQGSFSTVPNLPSAPYPAFRRSETLVDVDGDGDLDLLTRTIAFNADRHLTERVPPRTGLFGEIELHARPSAPGWNPFALLYTARTGVRPIDLGPIGDLRLEPTTLTSLGFFSIPANTGSTVLRYPVPAGAGLIGTRIPLQALVSNSATELHTTNAIELRVDL